MSEAIHHTVFFALRHAPGSVAESAFLERADALAAIPGVERFRCVREVSAKNAFRFGLLMQFADQAAYDGYNEHPEHRRFVDECWIPEVSEFQEIDYTSSAAPDSGTPSNGAEDLGR